MIQSKCIYSILDLLLDSDDIDLKAKEQINFVFEAELEYTSSGLFVTFNHNTEIDSLKINNLNLVLDGVKIKNEEYKIEADAMLFFKNGFIDYLEIWCYTNNYPSKELTQYTISQQWENSNYKTIST